MKNTLKIFATILFFTFYGCKAQQMVQIPNDAQKIKINEQQFLNKPLKKLLDQIKPEIKMASVTRDYPDYFAFKFITIEELRHKTIGRKLISIYVYTKEPIDWDFDNRPKGNEYSWTKDDMERYGNLTVIRIKVIERIED